MHLGLDQHARRRAIFLKRRRNYELACLAVHQLGCGNYESRSQCGGGGWTQRVWRMFRVRDTSVCFTSCSVNAHFHYRNTQTESGWMWRESPCVLTSVRGHRVPPVTDLSHTRKSVQEGVVWSLYWHPLSSHLLPGHSHANIFPGILAICDFVCLCQHQHNCYIKFHHCC